MCHRVLTVVWCAGLIACQTAAPIVSGTRASCEPSRLDASWLAAGPVYRPCEVDREAIIRDSLPPVRWRPRPGVVDRCNGAVVEFVVDTLGFPEPGSGRVVRATEPGLGLTLLKASAAWRYTPAMKERRPVRQVMREPFIVVQLGSIWYDSPHGAYSIDPPAPGLSICKA